MTREKSSVYLEKKVFSKGKPQLGNSCSDKLKFSPGHIHCPFPLGKCKV